MYVEAPAFPIFGMTSAPFADALKSVFSFKIGLAPIFSQPLFSRRPVTDFFAYRIGAKAVSLAQTWFNDEALAAMGTAAAMNSAKVCFHLHPDTKSAARSPSAPVKTKATTPFQLWCKPSFPGGFTIFQEHEFHLFKFCSLPKIG
jgi:hypothetical protein